MRGRTPRRTTTLGLTALGIISATALLLLAQSAAPISTASPGAQSDGTMLLHNGWRVAPAGKHVSVGPMPLNLVQSLDGRYIVVSNNGIAKPSLHVIDVGTWSVKSVAALDNAWLGLALSPDGSRIYVSGASQNVVQEFTFADGVLTRARTFALPAKPGETFVGGLTVSPDGKRLFVTRLYAMTLSSIDLATGQLLKTVDLPAEPYSVVASPDGRTVYVSMWGLDAVQGFDSTSLVPSSQFVTGVHPNAMVLSKDGLRLFVACGGSSAVWVFDTTSGEAIEQISTSLYPDAPPTSTPNALGLSPDGKTLLIAAADNNAVAVVDVSNPGRSFVNGFIPCGRYPTGAIFSRDATSLFILSGRGLLADNPAFGPEKRWAGALSVVPLPDRVTLGEYTRKVVSLSPYSDTTKLAPPNVPVGSPIPHAVGAPSPIKHVFYVIRENRSYDQVLGDLAAANGSPQMALFGGDVTPNAHALAQSFVVFDNFYVDADVSYNGHAYSTAAYSNDFIEKNWQTFYAGRGGLYLAEGGWFIRTPFGNITAPPLGYIWDFARRGRVTVRDYGEFVLHTSKTAAGDVTAVGTVPGLQSVVAPTYPGWDLTITDGKRADEWLKEFRAYEQDGTLPQLSIIRLPNDHTNGTVVGAPTPRAMVADNDLALGRMIEAISSSVYWKDSAVFVLEDDAQSGMDHVDSHRSVLLVASPFARRSFIDHTFYTTSSVLRTIELILGLPPMSMYDAAATPLYNAFSGTPTPTAYRRLDPRVPIDERNVSSSFGARTSASMNFLQEDRAPERLLNEILWHSIKGARSEMPPPRRSVFVRSLSGVGGDDD
jgi:DNA-binding beta-propeller fold protein YncE